MSTSNACETINKTREKSKLSKRYNCIYLNDDKTSFEFVIETLMSVFNRTEDDAFVITYAIHTMGKGVANSKPLSKDIAETKRDEVLALAKEEGFPLKVIIEEIN